jgi:hypothetical protein
MNRMGKSNDLSLGGGEVDAFLARVRGESSIGVGGRGRLIFALDATMSRQPTWDMACRLQGEMFSAIGGLDVQLVYYRGRNECRASQWISGPEQLGRLMERIDCRVGETQIGKILEHVKREARIAKVDALVLVGDAVEEEIDRLGQVAAGLVGVPAFMFQEGADRNVERAFREIARLTKGAYSREPAPAPGMAAQRLTPLKGH